MLDGPENVPVLFVNREGTLLHTDQCQHRSPDTLAMLEVASADQQEALPLCSSCRNVLDHGGRSSYPTLEVAMEALPVPLANRARAREIAAGLDYGYIWIPASRSYVGVSPRPGSTAVAYFSKGFVEVYRSARSYDREWLPENGGPGGGRSGQKGAVEPVVCPTCFTQLPATGRCDTCS